MKTTRLFLSLGLILTIALGVFALVPHSASAAPVPWSDSLAEYGMPSAPQQWQPSNWDVQIHVRDNYTGPGNMAHNADHGADCSAPPAQHPISSWQQAVFVCHSHVMTSIADEGYGEAVLTPDHMADWSGGPVSIGFSVSSRATSLRDWITVTVSPFAEQLALPFDEGDVDLQGMPRDAIQLKIVPNNGHISWIAEQTTNFDENDLQQSWDVAPLDAFITPSASVRTPYVFTYDATSYSLKIGPNSAQAAGQTLLSGKWPKPLTYTQGVVQFGHHSYNPQKSDGCGPPVGVTSCQPTTWHWSDFSISSAVQYTLLRPIDHQVVTQPGGVVSFGAPAPANSFLKFAGIGTIKVSFDGGKTYTNAVKAPQDPSLAHDEHFSNYMTPVPAGTTSVTLSLAGGWFGPGYARDFSMVSQSVQNGTPPPSPTNTPIPPTATITPTNTPTPPSPTPVPPTPTPAPPTPTPGPTPIPLNNTPCTVTLNGQQQSGTCTGTFTPSSTTPPPPPPSGAAPHLNVAGNALINGDTGQPVRLHGVNMDGADYACAQNFGFFDYPATQATVDHLKAFGANAVRIPMNEDCWLGNGTPAQYSGANYQTAILAWVHLLEKNGITPIMEIQMGKAQTALPLPDANAAPFWVSVVNALGVKDTAVIIDTFNEPHDVTWAQWKTAQQQIVSAIRGANGEQVIALEGLSWGADLSGFLANKPSDNQSKLIASFHAYGDTCAQSCWTSNIAPVAAQVPVYAGEFGDYSVWSGAPNNATFTHDLLTFLDQYPSTAATAWTYNAWSKAEAMVTDWTSYGLKPWGQEVSTAFKAAKQ